MSTLTHAEYCDRLREALGNPTSRSILAFLLGENVPWPELLEMVRDMRHALIRAESELDSAKRTLAAVQADANVALEQRRAAEKRAELAELERDLVAEQRLGGSTGWTASYLREAIELRARLTTANARADKAEAASAEAHHVLSMQGRTIEELREELQSQKSATKFAAAFECGQKNLAIQERDAECARADKAEAMLEAFAGRCREAVNEALDVLTPYRKEGA